MTLNTKINRGPLARTMCDSAFWKGQDDFPSSQLWSDEVEWEPKGASDNLGDFEIQWENTQPIFVEVKDPCWEGELEDNEKVGPRRSQPRNLFIT